MKNINFDTMYVIFGFDVLTYLNVQALSIGRIQRIIFRGFQSAMISLIPPQVTGLMPPPRAELCEFSIFFHEFCTFFLEFCSFILEFAPVFLRFVPFC